MSKGEFASDFVGSHRHYWRCGPAKVSVAMGLFDGLRRSVISTARELR